jgi:antitoxin ParD1/3/4
MPKRVTMNISLPAASREWIADRVSEGGYSSASEYVRELVREDRERKLRDSVDSKLLEALASGDSREMKASDFARIRKEVRRRAEAKPRRRG